MTRQDLPDASGQVALRLRAECMSAPTLFLDDEVLSSWMLIQHASVELYAQAMLQGQANGPRRFLGVLPAGALLPQLSHACRLAYLLGAHRRGLHYKFYLAHT